MYTSDIITYLDWLLAPFYILFLIVFAQMIKKKYINHNPIYKYFTYGLAAKIIGALSLCMIYVYYYKTGGDTLNYHRSAKAMINLFLHNPNDFFTIWFGSNTQENFSCFNYDTGYPSYWNDYNAFNVVRLLVPLEFISFGSYLAASVIMAAVSFSGIWKLYSMFCELYPQLYKQLAFAMLFIPSVLFWGSGILKDSWTLAACGWFSYSFFRIFIHRRNLIINILSLAIASFILIAIKPYIFVALMPGCLIWGTWGRIVGIKNYLLRIIFIPFILSFGVAGGIVLWGLVSTNLGKYSSVDSMIQRAAITSEDLKQSYYEGSSFDIGSYEPSLSGIMSKFHIATVTGLFRPFFWEARNVVMVLSGIENLILLLFFLYVFLKNSFSGILILFNQPLVLFSLIFALFFAFSIAISTSNFGALVRLRIPLLPFFVSGLMIIEYFKKEKYIYSNSRK